MGSLNITQLMLSGNEKSYRGLYNNKLFIIVLSNHIHNTIYEKHYGMI